MLARGMGEPTGDTTTAINAPSGGLANSTAQTMRDELVDKKDVAQPGKNWMWHLPTASRHAGGATTSRSVACIAARSHERRCGSGSTGELQR
jgi:hypothetical protein